MKTKKSTPKSSKSHGNVKVAASRGAAWKKSLVEGKFDARFNPTLLRLSRVKKDLNQNALAKKVGISPATYGSIERGKRPVSEKRALLIAKELGVVQGKLFSTYGKNKRLALSATQK